MSLTSGVISKVSSAANKVVLSATAATGGTGPYTEQWYRSTVSGFSPGSGNILSGKTGLSLTDTDVIPGTQYYYAVIYTDTGNSDATVDSANFAVATPLAEGQSPNQFDQSVVLGMIDQRFDFNTTEVQIDDTQTLALVAGQAVKVVDSAGGVPKVVACADDSDDCFGFINFNIKNKSFVAGNAAEISQAGNVVYLIATAAIARGARVQLDVATIGGVAPVAADGSDVVGYAFDKAVSTGDIIRVKLTCPSFVKSA